ncbi:TPA: hypothetical protein QDB18_003682 [Burkholderia vietnamiensis]|nr:hypothetical protein [Burkholderia vietnamiensis]
MTDRELLELAAKAAGFGGEHGTTWTESEYPKGSGKNGALWNYVGHGDTAKLWNPLSDDGDALRLAEILRIEYIFVSDRKSIQCSFAEHTEMGDWETYLCDEPIGDDVQTSMRKALVRAAVEIGKRGEQK